MSVGSDYYWDAVRDHVVVDERLADIHVGPARRGGNEGGVGVGIFVIVLARQEVGIDELLLAVV